MSFHTNPDLFPAYGEAGRDKAEREFGLDRLVSQTLAVLQGSGLEGLIVTKDQRRDQFELAARRLYYSSSTRYRARGEFLFAGIPFAGAHVLEVGCGSGAWAIWAALHDADRVIGIDPEAHGSSQGDFATFQQTIETLDLTQKVIASDHYLHQLPAQEQLFDVVIMYDVINHLDEEAVIVLHRDPDACKRYVGVLQGLRSRICSGGWVVVADCARDNLWVRLGLPSPFTHHVIDWNKHQNPEIWINLFKQAGFQCFDLRWSPLHPFRRLTSNRLVQYVTYSHFVLRLRAT